ncbi:hypothetical protein HO173_006278 [Letharia columbiana]|uniref:Major facilitator superfamily (MFS) profile domain-containing protein n=1 Tax=Letharia columbiana TaxID=112416 RepID=A0A8H6L4T0_9LECA|nr:uncharacterized protein HO173_006278 [Letharia columbiana]KAF6235595.1 hypothetical protein HO173_006278 [Letharia columbiana]
MKFTKPVQADAMEDHPATAITVSSSETEAQAHQKAVDDQATHPALQTVPHSDSDNVAADFKNTTHSWRFWAILASLSISGLLSAIEGTIITSALPTIIADLGGGELYLWIANAFFLASVATLPLYGQASDILGRRWLMLSAVALFTLGSGLSGGASSMKMLIAARTVQGLGGGGINMLIELIVTDLVPLRERGKYMPVVLIASLLGAALGPFIGGVITSNTTWRWIFYLNVPIGGVALVLLFFFLHTNYQSDQTMARRFVRIDFSGNAIFIATITAVLLALTWGGTLYAWSNFRVILPLVLGFLGLCLFVAFEWTPRLCPEPSFPQVLLANRTSSAALALTLIHSMMTYWIFYFLPIYFQAVQNSSPERSGVQTLPIFVGILPFAMAGGLLLSKTGRYKQMHFAGFALLAVAYGLFSIMKPGSRTATWVCFQLLAAIGAGGLAGIILPAMQAPLDESHVATATGVWSFVRGFGAIWGVTIPSAVFNNKCDKLAKGLSDPKIAEMLSGGKAYQYATAAFVKGIKDEASRGEVVHLFTKSMQLVWLVGIAFAGIGFLITFVEKEVKLRDELDTKYGMKENAKGETGLDKGEDMEMKPYETTKSA